METPDKNTLMFAQLILMLHGAAMQNMGKVKNPVTDKIERDLMASQAMIDILEMLRVKTKGNLTTDELTTLDQMLRDLRLNYVDEVNKERSASGGGGAPSA
jgi:hypothetical protein